MRFRIPSFQIEFTQVNISEFGAFLERCKHRAELIHAETATCKPLDCPHLLNASVRCLSPDYFGQANVFLDAGPRTNRVSDIPTSLGTQNIDEIVRQKDAALKQAVEQLARGDVWEAIQNLDQQGRVHEVADRTERLTEIAREYARESKGTLVISPNNESRRELNTLIHREMQERGEVSQEEYKLRVLDSRQEMTGADRQWAAQ